MSQNKKFKILIYPGLHARPGSEFVKLCQGFDSSVTIVVGDKTANGKSLLSLFKVEPKQYSEIEINIDGSDEEILMRELTVWKTEAFRTKEDFDNPLIEEELLTCFEVIDNEWNNLQSIN